MLLLRDSLSRGWHLPTINMGFNSPSWSVSNTSNCNSFSSINFSMRWLKKSVEPLDSFSIASSFLIWSFFYSILASALKLSFASLNGFSSSYVFPSFDYFLLELFILDYLFDLYEFLNIYWYEFSFSIFSLFFGSLNFGDLNN